MAWNINREREPPRWHGHRHPCAKSCRRSSGFVDEAPAGTEPTQRLGKGLHCATPTLHAPRTQSRRWCPEPGSNRYAPCAGKRRILSPLCLPIPPSGPKNPAQRPGIRIEASHAACGVHLWRRDPESNRADRICNPVHNRFAIAPGTVRRQSAGPSTTKGSSRFPLGQAGHAAILENLERETRRLLGQ